MCISMTHALNTIPTESVTQIQNKSFLMQLSEIGQLTNKRKGFVKQGTLQIIRENISDKP